LTQIERRQYRIRAIREKYKNPSARLETEFVDRNPEAHHQIGKSQNFPEHIGMFLQKHDKDPATKVSIHFEVIGTENQSQCAEFRPQTQNTPTSSHQGYTFGGSPSIDNPTLCPN
jgi:hypothetical protein